MSITINGMDGNPATTRDVDASPNNFVYANFLLAFSGSYSTGGDTLDLTTISKIIPSATFLNAFIDGNGTGSQQSAAGGYYQVVGNPIAGTALNGYKVKIFSAGGSELSAGSYPSAVTGDYVTLQTMWRKLI